MNIPILFLWIIFIHYGGYSTTATDASKKCRTAKELNELCGEHTYQSINPILKYVGQLQKETREINDMREKVQQLKVKETEVKLKDDLITSKDTHIKDLENFKDDLITSKDTHIKDLEKSIDNLITSKDKHIQDLQTTISELRDTNRVLKQNVESVNRENVELKSSIREELDRKLSNIDSNKSNLSLCEEQLLKNNLTIVQNASQLKSKDAALKTCESSLSEYKLQSEIHNKTIAENTSTISQLKAKINSNDQTLRESQKKLNENQFELSKQKEIIQQKDQEVSKLKEQIKENKEITTACTTNYNGIHNVKIPNFDTFPALYNIDIAGSGWIVIQQRINGGEDFYRNWETYKNGFGNFTGDFFLGLEKIHRLTMETPHELYIHMEAFHTRNYKRNSFYARYDNFMIAGEGDKYRLLSLGSYSGNADRDRIRYSEHQPFSTFDSNNDEWHGNCAVNRRAGWWFKNCAYCNLNGKYYQQEAVESDSNWWVEWYSLKTIKMMIRPRGN